MWASIATSKKGQGFEQKKLINDEHNYLKST